MNIIFMGTPDFAVPSLKSLAKSDHEISAVVTGEDKKRGRGQRVCKTAVKKYAEKIDSEILQPSSLDDSDFIARLKELNPDLIVIVAFRILPPKIIEIPSQGAINLHASLLPKYRGPAPINWAIINGDDTTGYTIFKIEESVDTGNMLKQEEIKIGNTETCEEIHDQLAEKGAEGLVEVVDKFEEGSIKSIPQNDDKATKAPKISSDMGDIDWSQSAVDIKNWINGLSPYPGAFSFFDGDRVKFLRADAEMSSSEKSAEPGTILFVEKDRMGIQTGEGILLPLELQKAGKKALTIKDFINGFQGNVGDEFKSKCS